ncbi:MAG: phage tail protein [Candidatus Cybelea sp.]
MSAGLLIPLHVFRFQVDFMSEDLSSGTASEPIAVSAAFAECMGLEATMEPKAIKEGGMNYGVAQRAGPTSFTTVILKRGISANADLFNIFMAATTGLYAPRMQVTINVFNIDGSAGMAWQLDRAMPVKYKFADLNARGGGEVGIEELHLVHEGLWATTPSALGLSGT